MVKNNSSGDFSDQVTVKLTSFQRAHRKGLLCPACGIRCYRLGFSGKIPLTIPGKILEGRCLMCYPIDPKEQTNGAARLESKKFVDKVKSDMD